MLFTGFYIKNIGLSFEEPNHKYLHVLVGIVGEILSLIGYDFCANQR